MTQSWKVTSHLLLWVYGIIPVTLLAVAVDVTILGGWIREHLVRIPENLAFWTVIFNLPHIVASHVTLFDRDYLVHYKTLLLKSVAVSALLGVCFPLLFGMKIFYVLLASYTMYHVLAQQYGLSLMLLSNRPNRDFHIWRWLTIIASTLIYLLLYNENILSEDQVLIAHGVIASCLLVSLIFLARLRKTITADKTKVARLYFYVNIAMAFICYGLFIGGYPFFTILIPRFVHDVTAFAIYIVHDRNRNTEVKRNYLYRVLGAIRIKPEIACVPLAIGLAYLLTIGSARSDIVMYFMFSIIFLHYVLEGRIWKSGTPHRDSLPIIKT